MIAMKNQIFYKKILLSLCFLSILLILPFCIGAKSMHASRYTLSSFMKEHIGEYTCTKLQLGEQNLLQNYQKIVLSVQSKGKANLHFIDKKGERNNQALQYSYDYTTKQFTFYSSKINAAKWVATPLQNGSFSLFKDILDKTLVIQFSIK